MAATLRGAPVDGVISVAAALHGDAKAAFAASGVQAVIIANPDGFKGHDGAAGDGTFAFPHKYGACINAFIERGARQPPCT